jgi:subtilisin family serine protease
MLKTLLLSSCLFISLIGFSQQDISKLKGPRPVINLAAVPENAYQKGVINIKFNPSVEALLKLNPATDSNGIIIFGIPAVDNLNKQYHVTHALLEFTSLLNPTLEARAAANQSPQFSEKHKQWGFNLWYQLTVPASVNIKEMVAKYQQLNGLIDVAEPNYKARMISDKFDNKSSSPNLIPNDLLFTQQWNYNNTGQSGGSPGSDIHLTQAWDIETGKPNVIVAVDDGGIQINHPDIAAHMWSGIGYNFVNNTRVIDANEHKRYCRSY